MRPRVAESQEEFDQDGISVGQILSTLWRRRYVLLATVACVCTLGFVALKTQTPTYTSTAIVILSSPQDSVVDMREGMVQAAGSDALVRSEIDALRSRTLVNRVIDREHLLEDPEFNPYLRPYEPNLLTRWGIADLLPEPLRRQVRSNPLDPNGVKPERLRYTVGSMVLKSYSVESDPKTYSVDLNFTALDGDKASRIANAFAEEYMKWQIDERLTASDHAAAWLQPRLEELSKKVQETGRQVEEFKAANNIVDLPSAETSTNTLALQEIQNLAGGLSTARMNRAQLEAAYRELSQLAADPSQTLSAPAVAAAPGVEAVRTQELAASAKLASLLGTYGDRHPLVVSAKNELEQLRTRLGEEAALAVKQLDMQMRQAQESESQLQDRIAQLTYVRRGETKAIPRLQQLESEHDAAKLVYDTFVQGLVRATTQNGVPTARGRIVQFAEAPAWPTSPNIPTSMTVIFSASLLLAMGIAYALEARDRSFHSPSELERLLNLPVLGVTLMSLRAKRRFRRQGPVSSEILAAPTSPMAESMRLVRTALTYRPEKQPRVVMVTSAVPNEGKTTFALMLGRQSAASGKRVIVVEAELRKPSFSRELHSLPEFGLTEYLLGRAQLDEIIGTDQESGMDFIAVRERSVMAGELLGGDKMAALIKELSARYDLVFLDTPPTTVVADALQLRASIDAAVLVVKWNSTPQTLVLEATMQLRAARVRVAGAVMTQVDPRRYRSYGHGALPFQYQDYYAA